MNRCIMYERVISAGTNSDSEVAGLADFMTSHSLQYIIAGDGNV